ncbi:MAG: (Fe-S)-binding protein [Pseudomonadota bacterium]
MAPSAKQSVNSKSTVALFVTCLVDLFRPSVAKAAIELLEASDLVVDVPLQQTCCGQPQYNNGDYESARRIAQQTISLLEPYDVVAVPSGSCAGMLIAHYPKLLTGEWSDRATALAAKVFELTQLLASLSNIRGPTVSMGPIAYHDSCAGLRELGIREEPRELLKQAGVEVRELDQRDVCCGFGGTFCAKMPDISAKMSDDKLESVRRTGAATLIGGDLGCLLALAGRARREGSHLQFFHVAEVLAAKAVGAGIGENEG